MFFDSIKVNDDPKTERKAVHSEQARTPKKR